MRKISLIIVLSLILSSIFSIIGFAETKDETIIKIGLQYTSSDNTSRKPLVLIKGTQPFEFGELVNGTYTVHFQTDLSEFYFDKDDGYHAVVGPYDTYESAAANVSQINGGFVVKRDQYFIFSASSDQTTCQNEADRLSVAGFTSILEGPNSNLVVVKNGTVRLGFEASKDYILAPSGRNLIGSYSNFNDVTYRGGFGAKRINTNDITLINYLYMDEYLYGVVPKEMSKDWPLEALKAQAIGARSFAVSNINKFSQYGFNLDTTSVSQVYGGYKWEGPISNQSVDETSGLILKHENTIVNAFYHSNSGGYTENSENVFSTPLPYIKGVYDPFSLGAKNDSWTLEYSTSFIENRLTELGHNIGRLKNFYILEYTDHNRISKAVFTGTAGDVILPKQDLRKAFGYNEIKSVLLTVVPDNAVTITDGTDFIAKSPTTLNVLSGNGQMTTLTGDVHVLDGSQTYTLPSTPTKYVINGKGWGHGLGMSQWGAKNMAEQGFNYEQILTFYYTDTHIE